MSAHIKYTPLWLLKLSSKAATASLYISIQYIKTMRAAGIFDNRDSDESPFYPRFIYITNTKVPDSSIGGTARVISRFLRNESAHCRGFPGLIWPRSSYIRAKTCGQFPDNKFSYEVVVVN